MRDPAIAPSLDYRRLLKRLYRFRELEREPGMARLLLRRRKAELRALLARDWPGGYVLTDQGDLVFVPAPLDFQGERVLFYGCPAPPGIIGHAPPGGTVIDVGANLGEWSVPLAKAVGPQGRVLCLEPNLTVAAALSATLRINNWPHAAVIEAAASDRDGGQSLLLDAENSGRARLTPEGGVAVRSCRIDALVAAAGLTRLDLIKIDVEGHERQVLDGADETTSRFRPVFVFESGHENGDDRTRIAEFFAAHDYDIVAVLQDYGASPCTLATYRAALGPCAGSEARNLVALPRPQPSGCNSL